MQTSLAQRAHDGPHQFTTLLTYVDGPTDDYGPDAEFGVLCLGALTDDCRQIGAESRILIREREWTEIRLERKLADREATVRRVRARYGLEAQYEAAIAGWQDRDIEEERQRMKVLDAMIAELADLGRKSRMAAYAKPDTTPARQRRIQPPVRIRSTAHNARARRTRVVRAATKPSSTADPEGNSTDDDGAQRRHGHAEALRQISEQLTVVDDDVIRLALWLALAAGLRRGLDGSAVSS